MRRTGEKQVAQSYESGEKESLENCKSAKDLGEVKLTTQDEEFAIHLNMGSKESKSAQNRIVEPAPAPTAAVEVTSLPPAPVPSVPQPREVASKPPDQPTVPIPVTSFAATEWQKKEDVAWSTPKLPSKADFKPSPAVSNPPISNLKAGSAFAKDFSLPPIHRPPVIPSSPFEDSLESFELVPEMPARRAPTDMDDPFGPRSQSSTLLANKMQFVPTGPDMLESEELYNEAMDLRGSFARPVPGKLDLTIPSESSQMSAIRALENYDEEDLSQGTDLSVSPPRLVSKRFNMLHTGLAL